MAQCGACGETIPDGATRCPLCLVALPASDEDVYELPADAASAAIPAEWAGGAVYTLEHPTRCPHCREVIRSLRIVRMKRTQVAFTSPLPRGGRVIACAECNAILAADLTTL